MEPTKRTLNLAPRLADVLARTRAVFADKSRFDPARSHRFIIGHTDGSIPVLVDLAEQIRSSAPNIELEVRRVDADGVIKVIDSLELDLAFALLSSDRRIARITRVPVLDVQYVGLARRGHPYLQCSQTTAEFAALPHLAIAPRVKSSHTEQLFTEVGIRRNIVLTIPHFLAAPLIVARTDLVTVIDISIARLYMSDDRLTVFKLPVKLRKITVDMISASARRNEAALEWLRQSCLAGAQKVDRAVNEQQPAAVRNRTAARACATRRTDNS